MLLPFLACLVLSINHVYLGIHVIARKVIFVDLALAQIAALGATYATTLGYDPFQDSLPVSLFSLALTFVGAGAFAIARMRKERVPQEAFIGIIYAAATAASILILSKSATGGEELKHMLVGELLLVQPKSVLNMGILYACIGVFHILFAKSFWQSPWIPKQRRRPEFTCVSGMFFSTCHSGSSSQNRWRLWECCWFFPILLCPRLWRKCGRTRFQGGSFLDGELRFLRALLELSGPFIRIIQPDLRWL
jgi:hypothetical protein